MLSLDSRLIHYYYSTNPLFRILGHLIFMRRPSYRSIRGILFYLGLFICLSVSLSKFYSENLAHPFTFENCMLRGHNYVFHKNILFFICNNTPIVRTNDLSSCSQERQLLSWYISRYITWNMTWVIIYIMVFMNILVLKWTIFCENLCGKKINCSYRSFLPVVSMFSDMIT